MDMIKILQAAGFTLKQIREIITGGSEIRRTSLFEAVGSIENKIHELEKIHLNRRLRRFGAGFGFHDERTQH